jgi:hypothetical protein
MFSPRITWLGLVAVLISSLNVLAQSKESAMTRHITYRTVKVDVLSIFYREAGGAVLARRATPEDDDVIVAAHVRTSSMWSAASLDASAGVLPCSRAMM